MVEFLLAKRSDKILIIGSKADSLLNFRGEFIKGLAKGKFEILACSPDTHLSEIQKIEKLGCKFVELKFSRNSVNPVIELLSFVNFINLFRETAPNIVICYTIKPVIYSLLANYFIRRPKIIPLITGLGYTFGDEKLSQRFMGVFIRALYFIAFQRANRVMFQNPDDLSYFKKTGTIPKKLPSRVINGSGVNIKKFRRHKLPKKFVFLMVARLLKDKGVIEYCKAAQRVKSQYPDIQCRLVGGFDSNPMALKPRDLDEWISSGVIDYRGSVHNVEKELRECRVFVLPSYREGLPRSTLEAMSVGRPVITTDVPGCRETVKHNFNGFLVPKKDVDKLYIAMKRMINLSNLETSVMAARSHRLVRENFDVHIVNQQMQNFIFSNY